MPPRQYHDYAGVIHLHSIHSDGAGTVPEIVQAAVRSGCSFLILTDHDTLTAFPREGVYGKTLLLVGEELTIADGQGHYLALRLNSEVEPLQPPQVTIDAVQKQGGLGFIAHPYTRNSVSKFNLTPVTWKDWNISGITGIEIWNYSHDWVENFTWYNFLIGWLYPDNFIEGPAPGAVEKFDELSLHSPLTAIGSVDAHGLFYPYPRIFTTLHTHLLLEEPLTFHQSAFQKDKNLIYQALKKGRCYLGYDHLGESSGFSFSAENKKTQKTRGIMGDVINLIEPLRLMVRSPQPGLIKIIRNGYFFTAGEETEILTAEITEPGVYRAEVYLVSYQGLKKCCLPWILSNPIYIR